MLYESQQLRLVVNHCVRHKVMLSVARQQLYIYIWSTVRLAALLLLRSCWCSLAVRPHMGRDEARV